MLEGSIACTEEKGENTSDSFKIFNIHSIFAYTRDSCYS